MLKLLRTLNYMKKGTILKCLKLCNAETPSHIKLYEKSNNFE